MGALIRKFFVGLWKTLSFIRSVVLNLLFLFILIVFLTALPGSGTQLVIPDGAALVVAPKGVLVDSESLGSLLDNLSSDGAINETSLHTLTDSIRSARDDEYIHAMVLDLNEFQGGGFSKLRDLGEAISDFRTSGKKVYAVSDLYTQGQYYLASFADEILLNPMGEVALEGFSTYQMFYREALDRLNVDIHIFRVGEYKSAVEPYQLNAMSDEVKAANRVWLDQLWQLFLSDLNEQRGLDAAVIEQYINQPAAQLARFGGDSAQLALDTGLVDQVADRNQTRDYLMGLLGEYRDTGSFPQVNTRQYAAIKARGRIPDISKPQVGLIIASGTIYDGEQLTGNIGGDTLAHLIRQARDDEELSALVLRIDSGGGSAFASEVIRRELLAFKDTGKPLVVSMGSVAASGGYWIAAPADEIFASPATITGSIGIYTIYPTFDRALDSIGINVDGVGTTEMAGAFQPGRALPGVATDAIQLTLNQGYQRFLNVVAEGRDMTTEQVADVAEGQVWSGQQAHELGLVDTLGNLEAAIARAAERAGLEDYRVQPIELPLSPFERFLQSLQGDAVSSAVFERIKLPAQTGLLGMLSRLNGELDTLLQMNDPRGLYLHCLECRLR